MEKPNNQYSVDAVIAFNRKYGNKRLADLAGIASKYGKNIVAALDSCYPADEKNN